MSFYKVKFILYLFVLALFNLLRADFLFSQEKLDLNKATLEQLKALPGIGEVTAKKILELREHKKGFKSIEELKEVQGIGDKKLETLKNYLTIKEDSNSTSEVFSHYNNEGSKMIYMYKDEKGNLHYTQFPELVPQKFRKTLKPIK